MPPANDITNATMGKLLISINDLTHEIRHSNESVERIERIVITDINQRLETLENSDKERALKEARLAGMEEIENRNKEFLVANWQKIVGTIIVLAPIITILTKMTQDAGVTP